MSLLRIKKFKKRLQQHGYATWVNNGSHIGMENNVDLIAIKGKYTFLVQIKSDTKEERNHGVRGLIQVAGSSDYIVPTYVYLKTKEAINLRTRMPVLKEVW